MSRHDEQRCKGCGVTPDDRPVLFLLTVQTPRGPERLCLRCRLREVGE